MFPILRRSDILFRDIDSLFDEMDEMMESSFSTRFARPSLSLLERNKALQLHKHPLGIEVTQDEKEFKVAVHVPDVEAKDVELHLDHDGQVLRIRGDKKRKEAGMAVHSRFEKAILLSPDVDTEKLEATISGNALTISAPKLENEAALENAGSKSIEIKIDEPEAAIDDGIESPDNAPTPTWLAVEKLKDETVNTKKSSLEDEKRWPARDFPY